MDKFQLGSTVYTNRVFANMQNNPLFAAFVQSCFERYCQCDWGTCDEHDSEANDAAVRDSNGRIVAVYAHQDHADWKILIITEENRSVTTILYPFEN